MFFVFGVVAAGVGAVRAAAAAKLSVRVYHNRCRFAQWAKSSLASFHQAMVLDFRGDILFGLRRFVKKARA